MTGIPADRQEGQPGIRPDELPDDAVFVDVREPGEWALGHAPNAVHIPLGELESRVADLPDPGAGPLAVSCRGGGRSSRAVAWLREQGFEVLNLEGGMLGWQQLGKPMVGADPTRPPRVD